MSLTSLKLKTIPINLAIPFGNRLMRNQRFCNLSKKALSSHWSNLHKRGMDQWNKVALRIRGSWLHVQQIRKKQLDKIFCNVQRVKKNPLPALGNAAWLILRGKFITKVTSFQETEGTKFLADLTWYESFIRQPNDWWVVNPNLQLETVEVEANLR